MCMVDFALIKNNFGWINFRKIESLTSLSLYSLIHSFQPPNYTPTIWMIGLMWGGRGGGNPHQPGGAWCKEQVIVRNGWGNLPHVIGIGMGSNVWHIHNLLLVVGVNIKTYSYTFVSQTAGTWSIVNMHYTVPFLFYCWGKFVPPSYVRQPHNSHILYGKKKK
jgi:hypothetical protein